MLACWRRSLPPPSVIVDLASWDRILEVGAEAQTATVGAGVRWAHLDDALAQEGLALQSYPTGKFSTVGGWVATDSYGQMSTRYGPASKQILSVRAALPGGHLVDEGPEPHLGAEGALGVITELRLRLRRLPWTSPAVSSVALATMRLALRTVRGKTGVYLNFLVIALLYFMIQRGKADIELPEGVGFGMGIGLLGGI